MAFTSCNLFKTTLCINTQIHLVWMQNVYICKFIDIVKICGLYKILDKILLMLNLDLLAKFYKTTLLLLYFYRYIFKFMS